MTDGERQALLAQRRKQDGWGRHTVWLPPEAETMLREVMLYRGESASDALVDALTLEHGKAVEEFQRLHPGGRLADYSPRSTPTR